MNRGQVETRAQLTGQLFLATAVASVAYTDLGNLMGHKIDIKRESSTVVKAEKGYYREVDELPALLASRYEFTPDEEFGRTNEIFLFGTQGSDSIESSVTAPSGTASFSAVTPGRTYFIPKHNLNTVVVTVSATPKTAGVDYEVDAFTGRLYIIPGGGIVQGDNVSVTFGSTGSTYESYTPFTTPKMRGSFKFLEFDANGAGASFREHASTDVTYWMEGGETHDGKKTTQRTLKILCGVLPTILFRKS